MKNITVFSGFNKPMGNKDLREFLREVKNGRYRAEVEKIRSLISEGAEEEAQRLKKLLTSVTVCALYSGGRRDANLTEYSGMVVLDLDDLSPEEVVRLRAIIEVDSHTYACFVSPGGLGLKVLVCVAGKDGSLPVELNEIKSLHKEMYNKVMRYYAVLTGATIDVSGKDVGRLCYVSYDPLLFLNEQAEAFADGAEGASAGGVDSAKETSAGGTKEEKALLPKTASKSLAGKVKSLPGGAKGLSGTAKGITETFAGCVRFTTRKQTYKEGNRNVFINLLANNCNRKGLLKADTERLCLAKYADMETEELLSTIRSAYIHASEHATAKDAPNTQGNLDDVEHFLVGDYELRYNVVSTRMEIRDKDSKDAFENVVDRRENSIWRAVNKEGIKCKMTDVRYLLMSDLFPSFNPFDSYFQNLPPWDGHDYIAQLAATVKTDDDAYWLFCFRKWLVAMVACFLQKNTVNHVVPVFCGEQGRGKTRWTVRILPPELQAYYATASIVEQEKDLLLKLSHRALVNIDELDVLSPRDMAKLKKLITQISIDERKAYGHHEESYTRHASLIASTNNEKILNDPTGSRRFITFLVSDIDDKFTLDYSQLYAQIKHLLDSGYRFWFDMKEITQLNKHNEHFQSLPPEEEFLLTYFRKPLPGECPLFLSASEILKRISHKTGMQITNLGTITIAKVLKKYGFESKRSSKGALYSIYEIDLSEVERSNKIVDYDLQVVENKAIVTNPELPF